eukprot:s3002_g1.t1
MVASFVRALQATDKFVDQISGLSTVAKVEHARVKVLCDLVEKLAPWKAEDASAACAAINTCVALKMGSRRKMLEHFTDKMVLEEGVDEEKAESPSPKAGSKLQNYTNLALFLPSDLWEALLDPKRPSSDCLMLLCHHSHQLGLLRPCERTCAAITCLGFWNVWRRRVDLHTKQHTVEIAKATIKSYLQHYEKQNPLKQCHVLKRLPKRVADLPPGLKCLFDKNPPGVADDEAVRHSQSMPCRRSHTAAGVSAVQAAAAVALDAKGQLVPATTLRAMKSEDDLSLAMLPAEEREESNGTSALCGSAPAERHDACRQLVLVEPSKPAGVGIAAIKPSKGRHGGDKKNVKSTLEDLKAPNSAVVEIAAIKTPKRRHGSDKDDVKSTLDDLKAKLNARRGAVEKSAPAAKKKTKAKAKQKRKKVEHVAVEPDLETNKVQSKNCKKKPEKAVATAAGEEQELAAKPRKAKSQGKGLTAAQKKSKSKAKTGSKNKGKTTIELSQEELSALIARVSFPDWFSCKKALLQKFPDDTEKRYTSRCYHRVKDFEIQDGKRDDDAKNLARAMHKHAKGMWNSMFPSGALVE